jgi:hypothetical protein
MYIFVCLFSLEWFVKKTLAAFVVLNPAKVVETNSKFAYTIIYVF